MSDPQSNIEIMDVLSSIRRLVSEGRKPLPTPDQAADQPADQPAQGINHDDMRGQAATAAAAESRFVLTPALRVADDPASEPGAVENGASGTPRPTQRSDLEAAWTRDAAEDEDPEATLDEVSAAGTRTASLEDTIAELEAAVAEIETGFEPDGGDADADEPEPMPDAAWQAEPQAPAAFKKSGSSFQGIMAGFDGSSMSDDRLDAPITADGPADLAPLPPHAFQRATPSALRFSSPETPRKSLDMAPRPAGEENTAEQNLSGDVSDESASADAKDAEQTKPEVAEADALSNPQEPETMAAVSSDNAPDDLDRMQPDEEASEPSSGRLHFRGAAAGRPLIFRPDIGPEGSDPLTLDQPDEEGGEDGSDADLFNPLASSELDVEMLRDMVTEIIREELRGTLGERITRNLRQLVRREIERALLAEAVEKD